MIKVDSNKAASIVGLVQSVVTVCIAFGVLVIVPADKASLSAPIAAQGVLQGVMGLITNSSKER